MKWYLPQILQCVVLGNSVVSSVGAKTLDDVSSVTEPVHNVAGQLSGFDTMTSEALLLIVFILLVLAVIAHKPKAP